MIEYQVEAVDSLEKIFPGDFSDAPPAPTIRSVEGLAGETVSMQLVYRAKIDTEELRVTCVNTLVTHVRVQGTMSSRTRIRVVRAVPVDFAVYPGDTDDVYISERPGLYPDLLQDTDNWVAMLPNEWRALWVDIELPELDETIADTSEDSELTFTFTDRQEHTVSTVTIEVRRIAAQQPALKLKHTEWLHVDCLAHWYNVPVWSEEHWRIIERYVRLAAKRGMTMIYTPLFTPPLDTQVGHERLTTQLVGVSKRPYGWEFDFSMLERWVRMCQMAGIRYFEMSHLFTQWGAKHSPKIVADVDGIERNIFGWQTDATDPRGAYAAFLSIFLPSLDRELHKLGIAGDTIFHISDEPAKEHLDSYMAAKRLVNPYLQEYDVMDALSDIDFYRNGACDHPIPSADALEPFARADIPGLWTYFCCGQTKDVPNRFMSMPSYRNRILGVLLYVYDLDGFLHWGFNFYNSQFSLRAINPYTEPGTSEGFAAGDAFLVYPGPGGMPEESIRGMVLEEALNDLRACRMLESLTSRDYVLHLLNDGLERPLQFANWPHDAQWLRDRRHVINQAIKQTLDK